VSGLLLPGARGTVETLSEFSINHLPDIRHIKKGPADSNFAHYFHTKKRSRVLDLMMMSKRESDKLFF
jgi:hypothetical protein